MEKEPQPDSITTVNIKPDYPPSELYSSEPPPAYHRSQSSAVQVARIIAVTVVLTSIILGGFLLASAYVSANASCRQLEQELELLNEAADKFQGPLQPEALIQDEQTVRQKQQQQPDLSSEKEEVDIKEIKSNTINSSDPDDSDSADTSDGSDGSEGTDNSADGSDGSEGTDNSEEEEKTPVHFKLPLQLNFDDLAGALIEKNQKSRMNCIVEKKRAEEVVDHQPKTLRLPFGLNLTTDPRYERITGERMAIFCESGNSEKQNEPEDEGDEETIMIQPVMIPIPHSNFPSHMAKQAQPAPQHNPFVSMEAMKPPMPAVQNQEQPNQFPPNMVLHHVVQQILAQKIMEQQAQKMQPNDGQNQAYSNSAEIVAQRIPVSEEILTQLNRLPNRDVIVTVSRQESDESSQDQQEAQLDSQEMHIIPQEVRQVHPGMRVPAPEMNSFSPNMHNNIHNMKGETQENREVPQMQVLRIVPQEMHGIAHNRENVPEMNGRQLYGRGLPVHIPVHMIQQEQNVQPAPEEARPHYVQPRSVRSLDGLLNKSQKRVKRCSCDCAC